MVGNNCVLFKANFDWYTVLEKKLKIPVVKSKTRLVLTLN